MRTLVFNVIVSNQANSDLANLPPKVRLRILKRIKRLESNPFPSNKSIRRIEGIPDSIYRLRIGDYRVIYRVEGTQVVLLRVVPRQALERALRTLR